MRTRLVLGSVGMFAAVVMCVAVVSAQTSNPRFGKWKLKSDAPAPASNVMTYEPHGDRGMKITVDAVNREGAKTSWWYITNFDGKDQPVTGNQGTDASAVTRIDDRINKIANKKDGRVTQILYNVLTPDGDTIANTYMRIGPDGKTTGVTFATYERIK